MMKSMMKLGVGVVCWYAGMRSCIIFNTWCRESIKEEEDYEAGKVDDDDDEEEE